MKHRNSYSDLGLIVAVSVFICILLKCFLFGFTWISIAWLLLACAYFYVSWRYSSDSQPVMHATTAFLILSVIAIAGVLLFDKNARPAMRAFEGTGDTIQDVIPVEEEPIAPIYVPEPTDTIQLDTLPNAEETVDSAQQSYAGANLQENHSTTTNIGTNNPGAVIDTVARQ